jgi:hypothetical protein
MQKNVIEKLSDKPIRFLNPRRDDWDSTWADKSDKLVEQIVGNYQQWKWHIL